MKQKTNKPRTKSIKQLKAAAILSFAEFAQLARRSVEQAWKAGTALRAVKDGVDHGEWLPWLEENDIHRSMAGRLIRLSNEFEIAQVAQFASVEEAYKAIPKALPPAPDPEAPAPLRASEKHLIERDKLTKQAREAEARAQSAEQTVEKQAQAIRLHEEAEAKPKPKKGKAKGQDVLGELQEDNRAKDVIIEELTAENKSLLTENRSLKRALKKRDRELADALRTIDGGGSVEGFTNPDIAEVPESSGSHPQEGDVDWVFDPA